MPRRGLAPPPLQPPPPPPKDDTNDEQHICSICLNAEETANHPSLLRHKNCKNVTHKECLYHWVEHAILNKNPTAFQCTKCRRDLPFGMILASANGNFDELNALFYKYKKRLDLSTAEFKTMLDSIPEINDAIKKRILEYIKRKQQHQQHQQQPHAATSAGHRLHIIEALNDNHSELYNIFYAHLHKIMFDEYDNMQEYRDWETDRKSTRLNSSH